MLDTILNGYCLVFLLILFYFVIVLRTEMLVELTTQVVYAKAGRLNHSCEPNTTYVIHNREISNTNQQKVPTISICCTKGIRAGEEITINYLQRYPQLTQAQRKEILMMDYGFE